MRWSGEANDHSLPDLGSWPRKHCPRVTACPNDFVFEHIEARSPALRALRDPQIGLPTLNAIAQAQDCPVRFDAQPPNSALDYERRIVDLGKVHTRIDTWHDRFNAAMWILWPQTKLSISRAHLAAAKTATPPGTRNRRRDALTLLDEVGVVIVAPRTFEQLHRAHHWESLFYEHRNAWFEQVQPFLLGHGLAEQCLSPYLGLTGKALYLAPDDSSSLDERLAQLLSAPERLTSPKQLCPFPILGTPGWHPDNGQRSFYRNHNYFRAKPTRLSSSN